jgi:CheY-like chemotaxis protein
MAEDLEDDVFLMQRALSKANIPEASLYTVSDGRETVGYLKGEGKFRDRVKYPFPKVVLTDLKMPGLDGFGFLRWARSHPECDVIPTIVFSASNFAEDVKLAYELGANAYLMKPHGLKELVALVRVTYDFWSQCQIPSPPPGLTCAEKTLAAKDEWPRRP